MLGIQIICATFFLTDVIYDLLGLGVFLGSSAHLYAELVIVVGLVVGIYFIGLEIRNVLVRQKYVESQLQAASGAFYEILQQHFDEWSLTPSERDVALFTIKGLSISEIAAIRKTSEGTIKAQSHAIYRKADVGGRMQLVCLFIDQLMTEALIRNQTDSLSGASREERAGEPVHAATVAPSHSSQKREARVSGSFT